MVAGSTRHGVDLLQSPGALRIQRATQRRFRTYFSSTIVVDLGRLNPQSMNLLSRDQGTISWFARAAPEIYGSQQVLKKLLELGLSRNRVHG